MNDTKDLGLWVVVPYVCLAVFVVGHLWRYRYDKFGWTTRSSQLYERRLLRIGSPLFHFGILGVFAGHVVGLGVPETWTAAVGVSEGVYHFLAVSLGAAAGAATVIGMAILIYRRRTVGPVFSATTRMDKVMYLFLATVIVLGLANTVVANLLGSYNYREGVSVWFRGIFLLQPHPELMAQAPLGFRPTAWWRCCCSRCGRSPAWCTCSARRSATCGARTWCTAARTTDWVRGHSGAAGSGCNPVAPL